MKLRVLVAIALSGLLATSIGFAAPETEMSDDMNASTMQNPSSPTDNNAMGAMQNTDMSQGTTNPMGATTADSNMNDDMSADTATGDDDY